VAVSVWAVDQYGQVIDGGLPALLGLGVVRAPSNGRPLPPRRRCLDLAVLLKLTVVLVLVGWGVLAGIPVERRLLPGLIRWARGRPRRGALVAAGVQLGALAGFGIAVLVAVLIGRLGGPSLPVLLESAALLVYTPVLTAALPTEFSGYAAVRGRLERAGASRGVARAIAWSGGTVALVGMFCVFAVLFELLYPS
jgi:hypothetical protein